MRIDLHTHSNRSDGTDSPAELVRAAKAAGLDVVALTDHDTVAGWDEAAGAAAELDVLLVKGAEISTLNAGASQHLLGYDFNPGHPGMAELLDRAAGSRQARVDDMHEALREVGADVPLELVLKGVVAGGHPGKKHFANALVAAGHARDDADAFERFLAEGRPASIARWKPSVEAAIEIIVAAGGFAVLAHPRGRGLAVNDRSRLQELMGAGLTGIEVHHREHAAADVADLVLLATALGLVATGSSDYHGTNKVDHDLGCHTTTPEASRALLGEALGRAD